MVVDAKSICAIVAIAYGCVLFLLVRFKKYKMNKGKFIFIHLSILYAILLLLLTLLPLSDSKKSPANLYPFIAMLARTDNGYAFHAGIFFTYWIMSFLNILLFVPFGFVTAVVVPKRRLLACIIFGALFSLFIELLQLAIPYDRVFDVDDIIFNTIGSGLGYFIAIWVRKILRSRNERLRYK